jgi:hypothetical protein
MREQPLAVPQSNHYHGGDELPNAAQMSESVPEWLERVQTLTRISIVTLLQTESGLYWIAISAMCLFCRAKIQCYS